MKTKALLSTAIVFLWFGIFLSLMLPAKAQTEIQYKFSASLDGDEVFQSIVLMAGSICKGIQIERSTDSLHFEQISEIKGICGSSSTDIPYSFTDINPVPNAVNYYRLRFGLSGYSGVRSALYVELNSRRYKIFPNPAQNDMTIYFDNTDIKSFTLTLSNLQGQQLLKLENIKDTKVNFSVKEFSAGTYFFTLLGEEETEISGKFVVQ